MIMDDNKLNYFYNNLNLYSFIEKVNFINYRRLIPDCTEYIDSDLCPFSNLTYSLFQHYKCRYIFLKIFTVK